MRNYFHLRDFVYLLRYLGREVAEHRNPADPAVLVRALQRNFGGTRKALFKAMVAIFADAIVRSKSSGSVTVDDYAAALENSSVIEALRASLNECIPDEKNPNSTPFRYILVLDPSDSEVAISRLYSLGLCAPEKTETCHVTDFANDADKARADAIVKMKDAMENGKTVILVNAMSISSSFYDVFNRHFEVVTAKEGYQYFANIAVGSFSQPCLVSPSFRVIVHLPYSVLLKTPAPFLNRFEKYYMSLGADLDTKMQSMLPSQQRTIGALRYGTEKMVEYLQGNKYFFGLVPEETINSLLLPISDNMLDQRTDVPTVPPVFHVTDTEGDNAAKSSNTKKSGMDVEGEEEEEEEEEGKLSRSASDLSGEIAVGNAAVSDQITLHIRSLNYHIFQLARPECVFADKSLPPEYLEEYLIKQEHFSLVRLVNSTLNAASEAKEGDGRLGLCKDVKWCLFTRTCGELSRIHKDKEIRTFFFRKFQMFEDADEAEIEDRTSVVSLQSVKSIEECDKLFSDFVKSPKKEVFVCVASMQTCSSDQINLIRTKIDTLTNNGSSNASERRHAFYVILHFPPEMQLLQTVSSSQAVFVNDWNYSYVDALGFSLDLEALDRGTSFKEMKKRDVDAKAWLAYAFGLNKKISNRTVENEFKNDIFDKAQAIIKKMASPQGVKRRNNLKYTKDVYSSKIRTQLPKIIDGLKKSARFAEVFDIYVRHVIKIWCSRLLKGIIRMDCAAIKKGRALLWAAPAPQ